MNVNLTAKLSKTTLKFIPDEGEKNYRYHRNDSYEYAQNTAFTICLL